MGDRRIQQIATDLDLTASSLRNWIAQADVGAGQAPSAPDALTTAEKSELSELRSEVKRQHQEVSVRWTAGAGSATTAPRGSAMLTPLDDFQAEHRALRAQVAKLRNGAQLEQRRLDEQLTSVNGKLTC